MNFNYVPVLKNRQEEINALRELYKIPISDKVLPLIEIVQEKSRTNLKLNLLQELQSCLGTNTSFMVDIINPAKPKKSKAPINRFFQELKKDPRALINLFYFLRPIKGLIPVISYDPHSYNKLSKSIETTAMELRKKYAQLAFRIKISHFNDVLSEISNVIIENDIIIFDIEHSSHKTQSHLELYNNISDLKKAKGIYACIVNSVIPDSLTNKSFTNGHPLSVLDNSLRDCYKNYGFSAFGDYATIKSSLPANGGTISPGFIFYSYSTNQYIGFNGRFDDLDEFEKHIIPSLLSSSYWSMYPKIHNNSCSGCSHILKIQDKLESGRSQGKWKQIAIKHYIYTMDKFLS